MTEKYFNAVLFPRGIMERVGSLLITELILQCIVLSLANQNLVPMFISEIGRPLVIEVK